MTKNEFIEKLRLGLSGLPKNEVEERLNFYGEMIDDRIEEGLSEEESVSTVCSSDETISQIVSEAKEQRAANKKAGTKRKLKTWEIVLMCVGSPIWISLAAAVYAVIVAVYASLWAIVGSLWAVPVVLIACFPASILALVTQCISGNIMSGLAILGLGIFGAGVSIFATFGCQKATKGAVALSKIIFLWIRSWFVGKEEV